MSIVFWQRGKILFALVLILALFWAILFVPRQAHALGFGGRVFVSIPCTNGGLLLIVGPPRPGAFLFQVGVSRAFLSFQLRPGPSVIGTYFPGGVCLVGLVPISVFGTILNIGTSF